MDVVERRDPAFWVEIAEHPAVEPHVLMGAGSSSLATLILNPTVIPLASENGGLIFCRLDGFGRVYELHTLFKPEGWGREVLSTAKTCFRRMFEGGCQVVTTYEVEGWWRSQPPKSFGFKPCGGFGPSPIGSLRTWILTRDAWDASPARRRA